tara:strand:+ start:5543 stop:7480 length:1938 start_codon:yes stop_codon:yes gene_type:complete
MANGYGSSSGSSSSTPSSSSSARQTTVNAQRQAAPPGYHYMPDGSLMSDAEHARLYSRTQQGLTSTTSTPVPFAGDSCTDPNWINMPMGNPVNTQKIDYCMRAKVNAPFLVDIIGAHWYGPAVAGGGTDYSKCCPGITNSPCPPADLNSPYYVFGNVHPDDFCNSDYCLNSNPHPDCVCCDPIKSQEVQKGIQARNGEDIPPGYYYMGNGEYISQADYDEIHTPDVKKLKSINSLNINTKDIPAGGQTRSYSVKGDPGASYYVSVKKGTDGKFYNDTTKTFASTSKPLKKFTIDSSGVSTGTVVFPAISADETYVVSINKVGIETKNNIASIYYEVATTAAVPAVTSSAKAAFDSSKVVRGRKIYQYKNRTTTFNVSSSESHWSTFPTAVTITRPYNYQNYGYSNKRNEFNIEWTVTMNAGGMVIARQPLETDFISTATASVLEATSSSTSVKVSDNSKILIGSVVSGIGVSGSPTVVSVQKTDGFDTVTLSTSQSIGVAKNLSFKTGGSDAAEIINGSNFSFSNLLVRLQDVTTAVNGAVSASTAVVVDSTNGLIASSTTFVKGVNVVGSGCTAATKFPHIDSINTGTSTLTLSGAQTLEDDTPLTITGSSRVAIITATCKMGSIGDADQTISLDLDRFLTQTS